MSISTILGHFMKDYSYISLEYETSLSKIYRATKNCNGQDICLKVIDKKQLEFGDYDFLMEQVKKEEQITRLCNSENTINFYRKIENGNFIIFELEFFESNLKEFLEKGVINNELFKKIVIGIAKGLKIIHEKGIMHRDIKPENIFIKYDDQNNDKTIIKIGDFGCSIFIKDNTSEKVGTILYTAPEIIKNVEYNEKCDLWSLGVTLFEIYFGYLPFGPDTTANTIMNIIYNEKNFIFPKTKIPNLNILFKRLLTINPKERMDFKEFFDYVFSKDFMNKDVICVNGNKNYLIIHNIISRQKDIVYKKTYNPEIKNPNEIEKQNVNRIVSFAGHLPDIMNFPNGSTNGNGEQVYNNIIYYDENLVHLNSVNKDSDLFERRTPGAFILCTSLDSLKLIRDEIVKQIKRDKKTIFNLITSGSACEKIIFFLKENQNFANCIRNICVFCMDINKWSPLKDKYKFIYGVYSSAKDVILFINKFSSKDIKPFPTTKLLTYHDYVKKYKDRHFKISQFYGNLNPQTYQQNLQNIKKIIETEAASNQLKKKNTNELLSGFLTFDIQKDLDALDKLIIREYTKNTFYGDLNKWLMNSKMNYYEPVAYFTARLMYSLNSYANKNNLYCNENRKELHRGVKLSYSCLLPYLRAKGKIILLSSFTSTSESDVLAQRWAGREDSLSLYKTNLKFSVVFIITNHIQQRWISNGINLQQLSQFKKEKEILYQPFSFYYVRDVQIDLKNYKADIYLETIGKKEILEEQIRMGKEIQYNEKEQIMQVKQ